MKIILASGSPRRKELLSMIGIDNFEVIPARGEEKAPSEMQPGETAMYLASMKAREVADRLISNNSSPSDYIIIAADTIVCVDNAIFGKPPSEREASDMLHSLSGKSHSVYTGLAVYNNAAMDVSYEKTDVLFRNLDNREIAAYVSTGEPMDKAGAYGIQGKASLFIKGIIGDYYNVMGLPLCKLGEMLKKQGVEIL